MPDNALHYLEILPDEVASRHAGLSGETGGYYDYVASGDVFKVVGACDCCVKAFDGRGLSHVQGFALRHALENIEEQNVAEFLLREPEGGLRPDVSGAYHCYLFPGHPA